jgi:hypothetical protein
MKNDIEFHKKIETIEFWRGEYTKRRFFLDNQENYKSIQDMMAQFKDVAQTFLETRCHGIDPDEGKACESYILNQLKMGKKVEEILGKELIYHLKTACKLDPHPCCDLLLAMSLKYGYIASDLLLQTPETSIPSKFSLIHMVQTFSDSYWDDICGKMKAFEKDGYIFDELNIDITIDIARPFGPNAQPWHKTNTFTPKNEEQLMVHVGDNEVKADIIFCLSGINKEDFQLQATLSEIEKKLCKARLPIVQKAKENFQDLADNSLPRSKASVRHKQLQEEEKDLLERISSPSFQPPKRYRDTSGEQSRAYGLFLWDTIYIEGEKPGEAIKELRDFLGAAGHGLAPVPENGDLSSYNRIRRITDRCIREDLFLSMKYG